MLDVIVISLAGAHDRRADMARQLDACHQEYHFLDAVCGRQGHGGILQDVDEQRFVLETGRAVTAGEIGCYASHVAAWRICSDSKRPVVILEDDAILGERFENAIQACAGLIDRCGFIRLQAERRGRSRHILDVDQGFALRLYSKVPHGSAGYVIGPRVAQEMARMATIMTAPIDVFMKKFWTHKQLMYGLWPYPVSAAPNATVSTIGPRRKAHRTMRQRLLRQALKVRQAALRIAEARRQRRAVAHPSVKPVASVRMPASAAAAPRPRADRHDTAGTAPGTATASACSGDGECP